jgi:hypothetical protein
LVEKISIFHVLKTREKILGFLIVFYSVEDFFARARQKWRKFLANVAEIPNHCLNDDLPFCWVRLNDFVRLFFIHTPVYCLDPLPDVIHRILELERIKRYGHAGMQRLKIREYGFHAVVFDKLHHARDEIAETVREIRSIVLMNRIESKV